MIDSALVTTVTEIPNYRVGKNFGIVRGIVVRSRSIVGNIGATLQTLLGGNITIYTELCEKTRADAHRLMVEHASELGANGIIGVRYDANEMLPALPKFWPMVLRSISNISAGKAIAERQSGERVRLLRSHFRSIPKHDAPTG